MIYHISRVCRFSYASGCRTIATLNDVKGNFNRDFTLVPDFLPLPEQRILLGSALRKLDSADSRQLRRRRKAFESSGEHSVQPCSVQDMFLPDQYYQFEEGHYDGVIHHFREMHVSEWPEADVGLSSVLQRLYTLCPTPDMQTHILHLASHGEILPHVDNVMASGSWILGVSLGADRIMRMEGPESSLDVLLPSGSVYLQKDTVRFGFLHSILREGLFLGRKIAGGQRLSLMIRDRLHAVP